MTTLVLTPSGGGASTQFVSAPSGIASGEVAVWNGSAWVRSTVTKVGYSSLGLTGNIVNADISASAAIDRSKLTNLGIGRFRATRTSAQTALATGVYTKVALNSETFDANSWFDSGTNYRYTPLVTGKYFTSATGSISSLGADKEMQVGVGKNGVLVAQASVYTGASGGNPVATCSTLIDMNGTTDYLEMFILHTHGSNRDTLSGGANLCFSAFWVGD